MDILQQQDKEYIAGTYARFPLTIEGGIGMRSGMLLHRLCKNCGS